MELSALAGLGGLGLFVVALLDSAFVPLPSGPDLLLMTLSYQRPAFMPFYVAAATLGSVAGSYVLYTIGRAGGAAFQRIKPELRTRVAALLERYDFWVIILAAILPPPFPLKVFVFSAGAVGLSLPRFLAAMAAGRIFRFSLEGIAAVRYGEQAAELVTAHYPAIGLGLAVTIVAALAIRAIVNWRRSRS